MFDPRIHRPVRGGWIAGSSLTLNEPATSSEDIDRKSGALRSRWIICLRAAGCPHGISLERVAQRAPKHDSRIVGARELLFPSTLPGSFDGCGSCPFFALAASQELAQKYPFTIDVAMLSPARRACGYPVNEVLWSHTVWWNRDHALVIKMTPKRRSAIAAGNQNLRGGCT